MSLDLHYKTGVCLRKAMFLYLKSFCSGSGLWLPHVVTPRMTRGECHLHCYSNTTAHALQLQPWLVTWLTQQSNEVVVAGMQVWYLSLCLTSLSLVLHTCTCNSRQNHTSLETCRPRVILFITCPPFALCISGTGTTLAQPRMGRLSDRH